MFLKVLCLHIHLLSKVGLLLLVETNQCFSDTVVPIYMINQLLESYIWCTLDFPRTKKIQTQTSRQYSIYYCICGKKQDYNFLKTLPVHWKE